MRTDLSPVSLTAFGCDRWSTPPIRLHYRERTHGTRKLLWHKDSAHNFAPVADVVNPVTWAGSVPYAAGIAPRMRIGHSKVVQPALAAPDRIRRPDRGGGCGTALTWVVVGAGVRRTAPRSREVSPGETSALPTWLGAQQFLNLFLMVFIIRSGIQILTDHPRLYWTRHSAPGREWFHI